MTLLAQKPIEIQTSDKKANISGLMYLAKDKTVLMNQEIIQWLTSRLPDIISIGGKTTVSIPISKEFKKRLRLRFVDGYLCQYAYTGVNVSLQKPKTKFMDFDFKNQTIDNKKVIMTADTIKVKKDINLYYFYNNKFFEGTGKYLKVSDFGKTAVNDNDDPFKPTDTKLKDKVKKADEKEKKANPGQIEEPTKPKRG